MALKDQPYFPFYVQDYLTDAELNECSASTQGIYVKIMCVMHKSPEYGVIFLKQKHKQNGSTYQNFASQLANQLPFDKSELEVAIKELVDEKVCFIDADKLCQKRMIKDNRISILRAESGSKGGKKTQKLAKAKHKATGKQNNEDDNEDVIEYNDIIINIVDEFYGYQESKHKNQLNGWRTDKKLLNDSYDEIDKLNRLDKFTYDDIKLVLMNAAKDERFWSKQIISLRGVRKKSPRNGQRKFQNAAVQCLKSDIWDDMLKRAKMADTK